jgi:sugar phosphate permease
VAARFLIGLGLSCIYVPTLKLLAVWYRPNEYATIFGFLLALGNAGALIATTPLAYLILTFGWRLTIQAIGVCSVLIGLIAWRIIRDQPANAGLIKEEQILRGKETPRQGICLVLQSGKFWPLAIRGIAFYGTLMAFQSLWGGPYLRQIVGADAISVGNMLMMISIGTIIASPISGLLSDRVFRSRKGITIVSMVLSTIVWIPFAVYTEKLTPAHIFGLLLIFGFVGGLGAAAMAQLKEQFPLSLTGTVNGTYNGIVMISGAFYQIIFGYLVSRYPLTEAGLYAPEAFTTAFRFLLISLIIGTVAMFFSSEHIQEQ